MKNITKDYYFKEPQGPLYHYTGIGALNEMCNAKTQEIWASSIGYMNDSKELFYALGLFKEVLRDSINASIEDELDFLLTLQRYLELHADTESFLYVFSLSEENNSLNQWRSYTPHGKGVCIEFKPDVIQNLIDIPGVSFAKCEYKEEVQKEIIRELIYELLVTFRGYLIEKPEYDPDKIDDFVINVIDQIYLSLAIIKHPAFASEREWRVILNYIGLGNFSTKYRVGSSMLTPYVALPLGQKYFLKSVRIGPTPHEVLSTSAIEGYLKSIGYPLDIPDLVTVSGIPYREW